MTDPRLPPVERRLADARQAVAQWGRWLLSHRRTAAVDWMLEDRRPDRHVVGELVILADRAGGCQGPGSTQSAIFAGAAEAIAAHLDALDKAAPPDPTGSPASRINHRQRPGPDTPLWQVVHPLTCGYCPVGRRNRDPLVAIDRLDGDIDLLCPWHPGWEQTISPQPV